jgi:hypothetical protein
VNHLSGTSLQKNGIKIFWPEARLERPALEPGRPRTQSPNCMRIRQGTHGKIELMFGRSTGAGKSKTLPG